MERIAMTTQRKWLTRLGVAGFIFFTVKGLAWLAVAAFAWWGFTKV